jgi:hypothetical protein
MGDHGVQDLVPRGAAFASQQVAGVDHGAGGNLMPTALPINSGSSMMSNTPCLVMSSLTTKLTQWLSSLQHGTRMYTLNLSFLNLEHVIYK